MRKHGTTQRITRRGFTLMESLVAATLLGVVVLAIASAVTAAQKVSHEGQKRILASLAADDLMTELVTLEYDDIRLQDGTSHDPGQMQSLDGHAYPDAFWTVGRDVTVREEIVIDEDLGTAVRGLRITVRTFDEHTDLCVLEMFYPEPAP